MRVVPKRSAAIVLAGVLAVGVAAVTRAATAEEVPSPAKATEPTPRSPRTIPRPPASDGEDPVGLVVGLKKGFDRVASASRFERRTAVDVTDLATLKDVVTVEVRADESATAIAALRRDPSVAYAEVNHTYHALGIEPNDPWARWQWNLRKTGVPIAWERTTGSSDVVVAVLDSGVTAVPDLAGALTPGKDTVGAGDNDPRDVDGHGTMVASLLAANTDNGAGIAGACWTCRILPVRVLDDEGNGSAVDIAEGINWAVSQNVDVINMSFGGTQVSTPIRNAVAAAVAKGIVVVAAAGNEGGTEWEFKRMYPAAYPGVLSVGATDSNDIPFGFSNKGSWISMAAPGEAWMDAMDGEPDLGYGTSMASPLVAGAAALILANHPAATAVQVKDALTSTTDPIGTTFGGGRLNAGKAVRKLPFTGKANPSMRITGPARNTPFRSTVTVGVATGADTVSVQGFVPGPDGPVDIGTDTTAPWSLAWIPNATDGEHVITVVATNAGGHRTTAALPVVLDRGVPTITGATPAHLKKVRGVVTVGATGVSDTESGVAYAALYADGVLVGKDTSAPYAVKYTSTKRNGTVKLQWRVFDRAGNSTVYVRSIIADNTAPKVKITSGPKNKAKVKGTVKLKVTASDKYGVNRVELLINGKVVATDKTSAYTFSVKVSKYSRKMKVRVRAVDSVGHVAYDTTRNWTR
jgi:subtilisin family serine protease